MKLKLKNFKTWRNNEFTFGDSSTTLISGPSGQGKSSILSAIDFALFGIGKTLITHEENTCSVELEISNLKIIRSKRPNRLMVFIAESTGDPCFSGSDVYEDDAAQEIIDRKFRGKGIICDFISLTPTDKLHFLEDLVFRDINISEIKDNCKYKIKDFEKKISTIQGEKVAYERMKDDVDLGESPEGFEDFSKKAYKRVKIQLSNSQVKINKLNRSIKHYSAKLSKGELEQQLVDSKKNELDSLQQRFDDIDLIDIESLTSDIFELNVKINKIKRYESYQKIKNSLDKDREDYQALKDSEETNKLNEIMTIADELLEIEELTDIIDEKSSVISKCDLWTGIVDQMKPLFIEEDDFDVNVVAVNDFSIKISDLEKSIINYEIYKNTVVCPSCGDSLKFIDGVLEICDNTSQSEDSISETNRGSLRIKDSISECDDNDAGLIEMNKQLGRYRRKHDELKLLVAKQTQMNEDWEGLNQRQLELFENLPEEDEEDELRSSIEQAKTKVVYLNARKLQMEELKTGENTVLTRLHNELDEKTQEFENMIIPENPFGSSLLNSPQRSSINDGSERRTIQENMTLLTITIEGGKKSNTIKNTLKTSVTKLQREIERIESVSADDLIDFKERVERYEILLQETIVENEAFAANIEIFEVCGKYFDKKEKYDDFVDKIKDLSKDESKMMYNYKSALTLKEKILEAESISLSSIVTTLNTHASEYLESFFSENPILIELLTHKETTKKGRKPQINIRIEYKGNECDIGSLSSGERDRVILAFNLAIQDMYDSPILMLDECTSSLDEELTNIVFGKIRGMHENKIVLIVAHQVVKGIFDDVLEL
ncbi:MAG: AAA family ATPase [Colwellia sp.]|nr:AAA family ATPase [Colwellia sp.]